MTAVDAVSLSSKPNVPDPSSTSVAKIDPDIALQIELDVAAHVFPGCATSSPDGTSTVDANFPIADACAAAPDNIAQEVNAYGDELARANSVKWGPPVLAPDVTVLSIVQDLMDLVGKHLS